MLSPQSLPTYTSALTGFSAEASCAPCRQAQVGPGGCALTSQRPLALLVYRPPWGECQRWLWGAGRGRGAQLTLFLAFPNQSSLLFLPAQPCCCFFFLSFGYLHYSWSRFFHAGAACFAQGKAGVFQGALLGVSFLIFFSQSMQAALAAIVS